jgi:WD40 repeat protein
MQILVGMNGCVKLFQINLTDEGLYSKDLISSKIYTNNEHKDIVLCVMEADGKYYSVGYDKKLVIYQPPNHMDNNLKTLKVINEAHTSGICSMAHGKDTENSWIMTGSYDHMVKLWSAEGKLIQVYNGLAEIITSVCFVPKTLSFWIAANSRQPNIYDPKSGLNISEYIIGGYDKYVLPDPLSSYKNFFYFDETGELIATTNRKSFLVFRYNKNVNRSILTEHTAIVEGLTCTVREPIMFFSCSADNQVKKWERLQMNPFIYTSEAIEQAHVEVKKSRDHNDSTYILESGTFHTDPSIRRRKQVDLHKSIRKKLNIWRSNQIDSIMRNTSKNGFHKGWTQNMKNEMELMTNETSLDFKLKERAIEILAEKHGVRRNIL